MNVGWYEEVAVDWCEEVAVEEVAVGWCEEVAVEEGC